MYSESHRRHKELNRYEVSKSNAVDTAPTPPRQLELAETDTAFEALLKGAITNDERALIKLIDTLFDSAWNFGTGKALRGELRRLWTKNGRSVPRFYAAFHALKERRLS